jgi:hypothetical protein
MTRASAGVPPRGPGHDPAEVPVAGPAEVPVDGPLEAPPGPDAAERRFEHGGRTWVAGVAGVGSVGTGRIALGLVDAIHFRDAAEPGRPLREALLARGRFESLYDEELGRLCDGATPIPQPKGR